MRPLCLLTVLALGCASLAQTPAQNKPESAPADISGMYSFVREGEFLQLNIEEQGKVSGFISRFGELESDRGAFLDQFIDKGTLAEGKLTFTTKPLHGVWYEFKGTAGRGKGKAPSEEAYYVLKGTLTRYITDANKKTTAQLREVEFKSFPQDVSRGRGRPD